MDFRNTDIRKYYYDLPDDRIAQFPLDRRDESKLLVYRSGSVSDDIFCNLHKYINTRSLLVFNNTRVINARLLFRKPTGADIEILCLEPSKPSDYQLALGSTGPVFWKCMVGNLKKWKEGKLEMTLIIKDSPVTLSASVAENHGSSLEIMFEWNNRAVSFGEIIESGGFIPLPPYIKRKAEENDKSRYQTIYSRMEGSVAAPTAGLHFTGETFEKLRDSGIDTEEITLHIGAGTFQPVKSKTIGGHLMHCEHFSVNKLTIKQLINHYGRVIAVGTTSVRTLESLYWIGIRLIEERSLAKENLHISQWYPYEHESEISVSEALGTVLAYMEANSTDHINCSTRLIIMPGYRFRMISGMITNFHQPGSTLLLLVSAWTGEKWREIYDYAMKRNFRFLSYGDSSLLL